MGRVSVFVHCLVGVHLYMGPNFQNPNEDKHHRFHEVRALRALMRLMHAARALRENGDYCLQSDQLGPQQNTEFPISDIVHVVANVYIGGQVNSRLLYTYCMLFTQILAPYFWLETRVY